MRIDPNDIESVRRNINYDPITGDVFKRTKKGWRLCNSPSGNGYLRLTAKKKKVYLHRLIWFFMTGAYPEEAIDHKNGIKTDNRWENLREATSSGNVQNRGKRRGNHGSRYKGVCWHRRVQKWCAKITVQWQQIHLGYYDSEIEAARIYNAAALRLHGEFANINVIPTNNET